MRGAALLASTIAGLVAAELLIRAVYDDRYAARPVFYDFDEALGWAPRGNLSATFFGPDFSMRITTDAQGNRLGASGPLNDASPIVVIAGDSDTFGWGVHDDETFASELDGLLAGADEPARVANLGVVGYGTAQAAGRLEQFLNGHPTSPGGPRTVIALLVVHAHNDMVDNVRHRLYRSGFMTPREARERRHTSTPSHIVNLVGHVRWLHSARGATSDTADSTADTRPVDDVLFAYPLRWTDKRDDGGDVELGDGTSMQFASLEQHDYEMRLARETAQLTELQKRLIRNSVEAQHCALQRHGDGIVVLHTLIHSAPNWYAGPLEEIVSTAHTCGADVRFVGRISAPPRQLAPHYNPSSAGHFTPGVNRFYARELLEHLRNARVIPADASDR